VLDVERSVCPLGLGKRSLFWGYNDEQSCRCPRLLKRLWDQSVGLRSVRGVAVSPAGDEGA
jgi:hypothetical protein